MSSSVATCYVLTPVHPENNIVNCGIVPTFEKVEKQVFGLEIDVAGEYAETVVSPRYNVIEFVGCGLWGDASHRTVLSQNSVCLILTV